MLARCVFTFAVFQLAIMDCHAVNGVMIWRKQTQEFAQLLSPLATLREENLTNHPAIETRDFNKEVVKAVYFEQKNMVMFYDDDTRITGICGELWHLLADYLNFTFVPLKTTNRKFGKRLENGSYTGLLGMLTRNEAQVILRSGFFLSRMQIVDYTMPIWKSRFHIYVQPKWLYDNKWVFMLFSMRMWYFIIFLFIVLSLVGYFLQKVPASRESECEKEDSMDFSLDDHVFYTYTTMCARGYIPDAFHGRFKILSISKSIFAWLILLAYSSHLIYRMANRETTLPFKDMETLFNNTKYILLALRRSSFVSVVHNNAERIINKSHDIPFDRVHFVDTPEEMHNEMCWNKEKYTMFEFEDQFNTLDRYNCRLHAIGNFNETWITFAIRKDFRHKKVIDTALIRFNEVGLTDALRDRWLNIKSKTTPTNAFKIVDLYQVHLIFLILCYGAVISFTILMLEYIVYYHEVKSSRQ